jgi:hypothetical protein
VRCVKECTYVCVYIVCMLTYYWRTHFNKDFCCNSPHFIFLGLNSPAELSVWLEQTFHTW